MAGRVPHERTYMAALWEYPDLCLGIFGFQAYTAEGQARYDAANIAEPLAAALATADGLLFDRTFDEEGAYVSFQYWESYEHLHRWSRVLPHTTFWKWLVDNQGPDFGFYHEIYLVKGAEAIYVAGTRPAGAAVFARTLPVGEEGQSRERIRQSMRAAVAPAPEGPGQGG